jgi:hypothetical protein
MHLVTIIPRDKMLETRLEMTLVASESNEIKHS